MPDPIVVKDETNPLKEYAINQADFDQEQALLAIFLREVIHRDDPARVDKRMIEMSRQEFKPLKTVVVDDTGKKTPCLKMWRFYVETPETAPLTNALPANSP